MLPDAVAGAHRCSRLVFWLIFVGYQFAVTINALARSTDTGIGITVLGLLVFMSLAGGCVLQLMIAFRRGSMRANGWLRADGEPACARQSCI